MALSPQTARQRTCWGAKAARPLTPAEALRLKGFEGEDDGNGLRRLRRTPRVFHRSNDIRHTKRNELRANLLPCILQVDRAPSEGACLASDAVEEHSEKYKHYKGILTGRSEGENETQVFAEKDAFPPGWDPSWQAVEACQGLRDLVQDRSLRYRRPVEEMVNVNSDLPFRHEDAPVDLEELTNSLTIEFQNLENSWKGTKQAFTSLQIASRVPLLVKDPGGTVLETQSLPNDVHTLRLDLNPGEVRHIACNMKSRHFKGTALERRLVQLVDPEQSALAALMRALKARETEARGHAAVLSDLLREVSVPLPAMEEELRHRRGDAAAEERLQALLADSRRTLARLLAVADKLAPVAQPLAASLAHAIDRMALICVREVDRVAIRCHEEYEQLLQAFFESDVARKQAEDLIEKIGGRNASGDLASRLKVMENELQQQARTHAKLIDEKDSLEVALAEAESTGAGLRGRVRQLEEEILHLRRRQPAWPASEVKMPEQKRCPVKSDSETSLCEIESEDTFAEADRQGKKDRPRLEVAQPPPPAVFTVAGTAQTDTEFYFCKGDDFQAPDEISFDQHSSILQTVQRLYKMLGKYEWNAKTGSFLYRTDGSSSDEGMEAPPLQGQRRPSMVLLGNNRNADIRRLKVKVQEAHQQAAASQLKEQLERLRPAVKGSFDEWLAKLLKESGSDKLRAGRLPDPDKLYDAVMEVTQGEGLRRRVKELEDSLNRLIPVADRLRQSEGDGSFWKRVMRSVKHSMTARRGSSAMRAEAVQRLNSGAKLSQINTLARLHGELALIWQTMPPKPQKLAAGTLLLRPLAPQVLQEAVRNYYLKSCNRHKQVEQAVFNLCRAVLQFAASYKVLLFAVMCDVLQPTELGGRLPIVAPEARSYLPSLDVSSLANLPFDAAHTMNEFITALKNMRRSRTFHGAGDGSFERVSKDGGGDAGPEVEREDVLLPLPLVLAAAETVCGRSKLTAEYFNVMLMGYSRQPRLLPRLDEDQAEPSPSESPVEGSSELRSASRNSESSLASSETGEDSDSKVPTKALLVSHLLAADRMRRHPEMWEETDYFVDSLWEAVMKRVNPTKVSHFSVLSNRVELAEATVAAQVTIERFRLQVPEALVASALKEVQPGGAPFDSERRKKEGYVTKEAVEVIMHLWRQCGGAASVCCTESHALWAVLWALALERGYEVQLMGRFFDIFEESGDGSLQYDEFVNFMAHIAPAVPEADCASFFMAVAEDTSADMTQEVFINLVQRVGVSSDLDGLKSLVEARAKA